MPSDHGTQPVDGSRLSFTESTKISDTPSMKFGTVMPTRLAAVTTGCTTPRATGIVLQTTAAITANAIDQNVSSSVTGMRSAIAAATLCCVV